MEIGSAIMPVLLLETMINFFPKLKTELPVLVT